MTKCLALATCLPFLSFCSIAQNLGGHPTGISWQQINNKHQRIIFPAGLDSQAKRVHHIAVLLESLQPFSLGNAHRKWSTVLLNQTTQSNAYVRLAPVMSEFYMNPGQDNFSLGSLRWDDNLVIHEQRHMHQFANFNKGLTRVFSFLLGQEGQLLANGITIPDYFFEGDAVWQETVLSKQGRGRMPAFYNGLKALWLSKKNYSWMQLRNGSLRNYVPDRYELGYPLIAYGYEKHGADFWRNVTGDAVRFKGLFYAYNRAVQKNSGISYKDFTQKALEYFKEKTLPSLQQNEQATFITPIEKNNVVDYLYPAFVSPDSILITRKAYNEVSAFYLLTANKEKKLRVKDVVADEYFSYKNGKIVYAAISSDARRANRDYSDIRLVDIYTGGQVRLTHKARYFSPALSDDAAEIIAVSVNTDGSNNLHRLEAGNGRLLQVVPNPNNFYFTQTQFLSNNQAVSAVRNSSGQMALVTVDLQTGNTQNLTPFTYDVLGYPAVKEDTVYFSMMQSMPQQNGEVPADKIFAVSLSTGKMVQLTNNINGYYAPAVSNSGALVASAFSINGHRLVLPHRSSMAELAAASMQEIAPLGVDTTLQELLLDPALNNELAPVKKYRKAFQLFNFHSARPYLSADEYGYDFYGNNVLSTFENSISYRYNRNERSSSAGYNLTYAALFPYLTAGVGYNFNRNIDTAFGQGINFNSAKANLGFYVPLRFVGGRTVKQLSFGAGYNLEQLPYIGIGKNVFDNMSFKYANSFLSFSNVSRQAIQHINPRWAQVFSLNYKKAFNFFETGKFVGNTALYFPGISKNHSLVLNAAWQKRDSLPDFFSNNFSYSRGYESLNTRQMYTLCANYHFPLLYPDWGVGNIFFIQRIRANAFFDYSNARARVNGLLTDIINRSTGGEIYFDAKIWNALPASIGIRYSHLLDVDLQNPRATGRWEIILPINIIPD
ncbi:MAG: hypothetical protein EOO03_00230 [Chitinophagaceae bacterium]|nr:MAG: hypothetical protein EOO03_00230 [Chitinophagaceae bacterium]